MLRTPALVKFCISSFGCIWSLGCSSSLGFAQTTPITITSAASAATELSAASLATATGSNLSTQTAKAESASWPTSLGGVTMQVEDSGSVMRPAGLLFVSPSQINFQIPPGTALGVATVLINNGSATFTAHVQIRPVAPALFSVNDLGVAAATAVRIVIPTQIQSPVPVFRCVDTPGSCRLVPIDAGVDAPVFLSFYGTGVQGRTSLDNVRVTIGSVSLAPLYVGAQGQFPGLDQINVPLPIGLRSAGEVSVTVTVDGVTSNAVRINVQ